MVAVEEKFLKKIEESKKVGKAVILLSGGMDSTTLVYDVKKRGYGVYPISFNYGQKHHRELDKAGETCKELGLVHKILDVGVLGEVAPSSLTRDDIEVPKGHYEEESMKATVVPNRNMVFLALAASYAIGIEARSVWYGAHGGDHAIYPDCRSEFVKAMEAAMGLCDWTEIKLVVPYLNLDKGDILRKGIGLGVDYSLTTTCYEGKELACGKCGACQERLEAFRKVGELDVIEYNLDSICNECLKGNDYPDCPHPVVEQYECIKQKGISPQLWR